MDLFSIERVTEAGKNFGTSLFAGVTASFFVTNSLADSELKIGIFVFLGWMFAVISWTACDYIQDRLGE